MSNINPQNIDGTFPIAGQDNNSQGFRDNFTNTINNFTFAAAELTDLQTYAVLTAPLSSVGQTSTPTNNMNYTYLTKPQLKGAVETVAAPTVTSGAFTVDWFAGQYQTVTITENSTMSFASTWPTTNLWTKVRLQVTVSGGTWTLTFPATVTVNITNIQGYTSGTTVSLAAGTYVFEFSSSDNGSTVTIQDVVRNYNVETSGNVGTFATVNATTLNIGSPLANVITTGNVIGGLAQFASINSTPIGNASASTGAFTTLSATGNVTTAAGRVDTGYQFSAPTANVAVTALPGKSRLVLTPTGTIISFGANVTLPGGNVDGTTFSISSNVATTLSVQASNGTSVSPYGNVQLTAGTAATYLYYATDTKWYKIS